MLQSYVTARGAGQHLPLWSHPSLGLVSWEDHAHRGGATKWSDYPAKTSVCCGLSPSHLLEPCHQGPRGRKWPCPHFCYNCLYHVLATVLDGGD